VLVPTAGEADELALHGAVVELCGFGLAVSGVRAAGAIARHRPGRVILAGLAGTYDPRAAQPGRAVWAGTVRCVGIGAAGQSAAELGFAESDDLTLAGGGPLALSVASASATITEARDRAAAHPGAVLEEMEGYAVALAAMDAGVRCFMVRGVANAAGDRDRATWHVAPALAAVREAVDTILST
jgi:futalosine hydrolase